MDSLTSGVSMDLARQLVDAVVIEGCSFRGTGRTYDVSKRWVAKLVSCYHTGGYET